MRSASRRKSAMPRASLSRKRCAIYTRKSSEEGLEQEFNSLAAQREACEAYIRSQQHEGWTSTRTRYDDGGFSGGNLERPALQQLLADIQSRPRRHRRRLQGRPADPIAGRFRAAGRDLRRTGCLVRVGHPTIQYDQLNGAADAQCAVVVCPVRARGHRRTHPRQDRRLEEKGNVDGRQCAARLRRQRAHARHQPYRG